MMVPSYIVIDTSKPHVFTRSTANEPATYISGGDGQVVSGSSSRRRRRRRRYQSQPRVIKQEKRPAIDTKKVPATKDEGGISLADLAATLLLSINSSQTTRLGKSQSANLDDESSALNEGSSQQNNTI